jgi:hypothetical protein
MSRIAKKGYLGEKHRSTTLLSTSAHDVPESRGYRQGDEKGRRAVSRFTFMSADTKNEGVSRYRLAIMYSSRQQHIDDAACVALLLLSALLIYG